MAGITRRTMLQSSAASVAFALLPVSLRAQMAASAPAKAPANTEWRGYGNDLAMTRYAPLDQINADNFNTLEVAWSFNSNALGPRADSNWQSTPILANGRLFVTAGTRRDVIALNPGTGELLWMYAKDEGARIGSRGGPGFGCSYWTDGTAERVLFATPGYQLISLDAKTGIPDPAFGKDGILDLRLDDDQEMDLVKGVVGIHATPLIVRDTVAVGCAPTAAMKGHLRGFDVRTGKRKWIFHGIPRPGEFGSETWVDQSQLLTVGNGGVWAQMSADPELG